MRVSLYKDPVIMCAREKECVRSWRTAAFIGISILIREKSDYKQLTKIAIAWAVYNSISIQASYLLSLEYAWAEVYFLSFFCGAFVLVCMRLWTIVIKGLHGRPRLAFPRNSLWIKIMSKPLEIADVACVLCASNGCRWEIGPYECVCDSLTESMFVAVINSKHTRTRGT